MLNAMRKDAQLNMLLYSPKKLSCGKGIAHTSPNKLNTISGTHIQWMALLVLFWWLSAYLSKYTSTGRLTAC